MLALRGGLNPSIGIDLDPASRRSDQGGVFCREPVNLAAGAHTVRLQVQLSPQAKPQQTLRLFARAGGEVLAQAVLDAADPAAADAVTLSFHLQHAAVVTIEGVASDHAASTSLRFLTQAPVATYDGHEARFRFDPQGDVAALPIRTVIFGTTAVCNANCFHCPTNKAYSRTQAKGWMDQALFERIVDELAEVGFDGAIMFGLFGEPLQDPLFPQRMRYIRERLPHAVVTLSTNGALYQSDKHSEALALADDVAIHIEAASPSVYAASMRPLKAARTFPRAEQLIADRAGKRAHIVSPVHRRNLDEVAALRDMWEPLGAAQTVFAFLMNRAGQADAFDDVALAPVATGCGPTILSDLIVDWDGAVLTCCQDFHRRSIIGDLSSHSLRQVLDGAARRQMYDTLNDKRWNAISTCAGCRNDCDRTVETRVTERLRDSDADRTFRPAEFKAKGPVTADPGVLKVSTRLSLIQRLKRPLAAEPRAVIFGPYKALHPGRYRIVFDLRTVAAGLRGRLKLEAASAQEILATAVLPTPGDGRTFALDVTIPTYQPLEFRVRARDVDFDFHGVSVSRQDRVTA